jgi:glycosyltransferase involved in cell wall biosynthesis
MKIVYLNPSASLGGAERCLLDMMAAIRQTDPRIELYLLASTHGPLMDRAKQLDVRVTLLPMPQDLVEMGDSILKGPKAWHGIWDLGRRGIRGSWATWGYTRELSKAVGPIQPDLIHSNGIKFHVLTSLAGIPRVPVIWHIHDFLSFRPVMAQALRWTSLRARGAIAVSRAVQQDAQKVLPNLPIELVYNGIDIDDFSPSFGCQANLDQLTGLPPATPETVRIGLVGTFARWKGHEVFLRAAAQILGSRSQPGTRFFIIGGPIYQTRGSQYSVVELQRIAASLKIESQVGFVPFQDNPADVYRALDIVVHASTQPEPFGRTIVEAMACAKPVIVARAGGAGELFTHDHDAIGVPPGDSTSLAAALSRLIADPNLRHNLGQNARRIASERFRRQLLGPQLLAVYHKHLRASFAA